MCRKKNTLHLSKKRESKGWNLLSSISICQCFIEKRLYEMMSPNLNVSAQNDVNQSGEKKDKIIYESIYAGYHKAFKESYSLSCFPWYD